MITPDGAEEERARSAPGTLDWHQDEGHKPVRRRHDDKLAPCVRDDSAAAAISTAVDRVASREPPTLAQRSRRSNDARRTGGCTANRPVAHIEHQLPLRQPRDGPRERPFAVGVHARVAHGAPREPRCAIHDAFVAVRSRGGATGAQPRGRAGHGARQPAPQCHGCHQPGLSPTRVGVRGAEAGGPGQAGRRRSGHPPPRRPAKHRPHHPCGQCRHCERPRGPQAHPAPAGGPGPRPPRRCARAGGGRAGAGRGARSQGPRPRPRGPLPPLPRPDLPPRRHSSPGRPPHPGLDGRVSGGTAGGAGAVAAELPGQSGQPEQPRQPRRPARQPRGQGSLLGALPVVVGGGHLGGRESRNGGGGGGGGCSGGGRVQGGDDREQRVGRRGRAWPRRPRGGGGEGGGRGRGWAAGGGGGCARGWWPIAGQRPPCAPRPRPRFCGGVAAPGDAPPPHRAPGPARGPVRENQGHPARLGRKKAARLVAGRRRRGRGSPGRGPPRPPRGSLVGGDGGGSAREAADGGPGV